LCRSLFAMRRQRELEGHSGPAHYHQVRDSWFGVRTPDGR
jgi:hypothetical protein